MPENTGRTGKLLRFVPQDVLEERFFTFLPFPVPGSKAVWLRQGL